MSNTGPNAQAGRPDLDLPPICTPGKWVYIQPFAQIEAQDEAGNGIVLARLVNEVDDAEQVDLNGYWMAAAPDLLAAGRAALAAFEEISGSWTIKAKAVKLLEAAIAKAEEDS